VGREYDLQCDRFIGLFKNAIPFRIRPAEKYEELLRTGQKVVNKTGTGFHRNNNIT